MKKQITTRMKAREAVLCWLRERNAIFPDPARLNGLGNRAVNAIWEVNPEKSIEIDGVRYSAVLSRGAMIAEMVETRLEEVQP